MGNKHTRSRKQSKVAVAHGGNGDNDQAEQFRQPASKNGNREKERVSWTAGTENIQKVSW